MIKKILNVFILIFLIGFDWTFYLLRKLVRLVLKSPAKESFNLEAEKLTENEKWSHSYLKIEALDVKELTIHVVTHKKSKENKNKKPLLLMIHGFPEQWYSWRYQLEEFAEDYYAVAMDMRGFGKSDKPLNEENYKIPYVVNDVKQVINKLGYTEVILMSHDWGAIISYQFLYKYPLMVKKNIIMSVPHPHNIQFVNSTPSFSQLKKSWYLFFFQLPFLPEFILSRNNFAFIGKAFGARRSGIQTESSKLSETEIDVFRNGISSPEALNAQLSYYRNLLPLAYSTTQYPNLKIPTIVFAGGKDNALDVKTVISNVQNFLSPLKITVVPKSSHWVNQDDFEFVNKQLRQFLSDKEFN